MTDVKIKIGLDSSGFKSSANDVKKVGSDLTGTLESGIKKSDIAWGSFVGNLGAKAAVAAFNAVTGAASKLFNTFAVDGVKAAKQHEKTVTKLRSSFRGLSDKELNKVIGQMEDWANSLQDVSVFDNTSILNAASLARAYGLTADQAKRVVEAAADMSAATGTDLQTNVKALSGTFNGQIGLLGRLNPELRNLSKEALSSGDAVGLLAEQFKGAALAESQTFAGQMIQAKNNFGDFQRVIGEVIIQNPMVVSAISMITKFTKEMADTIENNRHNITAFFTSILDGFGNAAQVVRVTVNSMVGTLEEYRGIFAAIGIVIGAVTVALTGMAVAKATVAGAIAIYTAATAAAAIATNALAAPIGLIALGLGSVIVATVAVYAQWNNLKAIFLEVGAAISGPVIGAFTSTVNMLESFVNSTIQGYNALARIIPGLKELDQVSFSKVTKGADDLYSSINKMAKDARAEALATAPMERVNKVFDAGKQAAADFFSSTSQQQEKANRDVADFNKKLINDTAAANAALTQQSKRNANEISVIKEVHTLAAKKLEENVASEVYTTKVIYQDGVLHKVVDNVNKAETYEKHANYNVAENKKDNSSQAYTTIKNDHIDGIYKGGEVKANQDVAGNKRNEAGAAYKDIVTKEINKTGAQGIRGAEYNVNNMVADHKESVAAAAYENIGDESIGRDISAPEDTLLGAEIKAIDLANEYRKQAAKEDAKEEAEAAEKAAKEEVDRFKAFLDVRRQLYEENPIPGMDFDPSRYDDLDPRNEATNKLTEAMKENTAATRQNTTTARSIKPSTGGFDDFVGSNTSPPGMSGGFNPFETYYKDMDYLMGGVLDRSFATMAANAGGGLMSLDKSMNALKPLLDALKQIGQKGVQAFVEYFNKVGLKGIGKGIESFLTTGPQGLLSKGVGVLTDAFLPGLGGAAQQLFNMLSMDAESFAQTMDQLFSVEFLDNILDNIPILIQKILEHLPTLIERVIEKLPQIATAVVLMFLDPEFILRLTVGLAQGIVNGIGSAIGGMGEIVGTWIMNTFKGIFEFIPQWIANGFRASTPTISSTLGNSLKNAFSANNIINQFKGAANGITNALLTPLRNAIQGIVRSLTGGLVGGGGSGNVVSRGVKKLKFWNQGGIIPGTAPVSGDSIRNDFVPAMLSPGEAVIPRSKMANPAIAGLVTSILAGNDIPRFNRGGIVSSTTPSVSMATVGDSELGGLIEAIEALASRDIVVTVDGREIAKAVRSESMRGFK